MRCMHTHTMYSGSRAGQLPVQVPDARPAAVGEAPGVAQGSGYGAVCSPAVQQMQGEVFFGCRVLGGSFVAASLDVQRTPS